MTIGVMRHVSPTMVIVAIVIVVAAVARPLLRNRQAERNMWINIVSWTAPVILLAVFCLPTLFLQYQIDETHVTIRKVTGQEQIALHDITSATPIEYTLSRRVFGTSTFAYHVGQFNVTDIGLVDVYAGSTAGRGVLIETREGRRMLLSPADPEQLLLLIGAN